MNDLRMSLKVCEGCGALWLRCNALEGVYCRVCAGRLAEFPAPRKKHAGGRKRRLGRPSGALECPGRAESGVVMAGGVR